MSGRGARPYDLLAEHFDECYRGWRPSPLALYRRLLAAPLARAGRVCDLACGTGMLAFELARRGHEVFAVDRHRGMLAKARERAAGSPRIRLIRGDMRTVRLPAAVDLAVCFFDSLNHLERRGDLRRVFANVARGLRPGGVFVFDLNTRAGVAHPWPDPPQLQTSSRLGSPVSWLASPLPFDPRRRRGGTRIDWYWETAAGRPRHAREEYWEIAWEEDEVLEALAEAGFGAVELFDGSSVEPELPRGFRLYARARREIPAKSGEMAKDFRVSRR